MIRFDLDGNTFKYEQVDIDSKEISKITHEINNIYHSKYAGKRLGMHRSIDLNGNYCIYYFENHGFDDYNIFGKYYD